MRHTPFHTILGLTFIALACVATTAQAQTVAPGPYYAVPSWDQKLQCDTTATCPRFIVLSNWNSQAVLDRETGLVWQRTGCIGLLCDGFNWATAQQVCIELTVGDRGGWRLPTIQELKSLADVTRTDPALPPGHPFVVQNPGFDILQPAWSATTDAGDSGRAWIINFRFGSVAPAAKTALLKAWCVRGGVGIEGR
jgi:hypothetical protein